MKEQDQNRRSNDAGSDAGDAAAVVGDALGTIVILTETSNTGEALKLVRASLNGAAV